MHNPELTNKPRLFRCVYGGGPKGGRWSETAKLYTAKRLMRMLVRVLLGSKKVAEYDDLIARLDAMTPAERETDLQKAKAELKALLERDLQP